MPVLASKRGKSPRELEGKLRAAFQADEPHSCSINRRVFYAHAGFARDPLYAAKLADNSYVVACKPQC